jgi:hypothetical protein
VGQGAGYWHQAEAGIALGNTAGYSNQGKEAIAIGVEAGMSNQGSNAIAIGSRAGMTGQAANSIVVNATDVALNGTTASALYINPIRVDNAFADGYLTYNSTTKEVIYNAGGSIASSDPAVLLYSLSTATGVQYGGSTYKLACTAAQESLGGLSGYNPTTGRFTNTTSRIMSVLVEAQIAAEQGNWSIDFRKYNGTTDASAWTSYINGTNYVNSFAHSVILRPADYVYVNYTITGPSTFTVSSQQTQIQFTQL